MVDRAERSRFRPGPHSILNASEMNSGPLSPICGGPPQSANAFSRAATRSFAGMDLSTILSTDRCVCSIEHRLVRVHVHRRRDLELPPVGGGVELESIAHTTFGASASVIGVVEAPANFADFHPHPFRAPTSSHLPADFRSRYRYYEVTYTNSRNLIPGEIHSPID